MQVRVIKTHLDDIELEHAKHSAAITGDKRLPQTEIRHDAETDKYHIATKRRGNTVGVSNHTLPERGFLHHVLTLYKSHPKMHPFPKEAQIETSHKRGVTLRLGHPNYNMYDRTAKKVRGIHKQRDQFLRDRDKE